MDAREKGGCTKELKKFEEFSTLNNGMEILFIVDTLLLGERTTQERRKGKKIEKEKEKKEICIKD